MCQNQLPVSSSPTPSPSRMRYVRDRLQADADAVLREIAYVLALTQRVKDEMLIEAVEAETLVG